MSNISNLASIALNLDSVDDDGVFSFAGMTTFGLAGAGVGLKGGVFFAAASLFFRIISANPPPFDEGVGEGDGVNLNGDHVHQQTDSTTYLGEVFFKIDCPPLQRPLFSLGKMVNKI